MKLRFAHLVHALGVVVLAGGLIGGGATPAVADRDEHIPPQVLPQGFESTDELQRDAERAERAPFYSAWLVESTRFVNVPFGSFMPDRDRPLDSQARYSVYRLSGQCRGH